MTFRPSKETLKDGFWPRSRFSPLEADQFHADGTLQEEYTRDVLHVGRRRDRLVESFCVARDVYTRYFLAIWLANEGTNHPF